MCDLLVTLSLYVNTCICVFYDWLTDYCLMTSKKYFKLFMFSHLIMINKYIVSIIYTTGHWWRFPGLKSKAAQHIPRWWIGEPSRCLCIGILIWWHQSDMHTNEIFVTHHNIMTWPQCLKWTVAQSPNATNILG
jgi:hypothetical protein